MWFLPQPAWKKGAEERLQHAFAIGKQADKKAVKEALKFIKSASNFSEKKELQEFAKLVEKKSRLDRPIREKDAAELEKAAEKAGIKLRIEKAQVQEKRRVPVARQGLPGLLWHDVSSNPTPYGIKTENFEAQMKDLHERGVNTVTASELPGMLKGRPPANTVVLTFDDGHESVYKEVFRLLKKYKMKATVFVAIKSVGSRNYVSWKQLKEMSDSGLVEIGSHALTHRHMTTLDESEAFEELTESKRIIQERLGIQVNSFAWPYGERTSELDKLAAKAGYSSVFGGFAEKSGSDPLFLKRYNITGANSGEFDRIVNLIKPAKTALLDMVPRRVEIR